VVQEALLKAFRYLRSFDPSLSFRNWLYQIAVNTARGFRKRTGAEQRGMAFAASEWSPRPAADDPVAGHEKVQARDRLRECLDVLSDREREVFWLREIEELSVEDTARVLKSSSISVRVHLNRARRKVLARFRSKFPESTGEPR
jgi:RNA polymerase sigma-70 factor (ECF subfamily)